MKPLISTKQFKQTGEDPMRYQWKKNITLAFCSCLLVLSFAAPGYTSDYYVTQSGGGSADGSSLANAWSVANLNSSSNWSASEDPSRIDPGDTVHLSGTISSAITIQGSGTVGNPVTIKFDSNARITSGSWGNGGAITGRGKNHIIIDGGINGLIECTNNGTNFGNRDESKGIDLQNSDYWEIKNLKIDNIYVRAVNSTTDRNRGSRAIVMIDSSNVSIHDNSLSDAEYMLRASNESGAASNLDFYNNQLTDFATAMVVAVDSNSDYTDVSIYSNNIIGTNRWDGNVNGSWHHRDGIHTWTGGGVGGYLRDLKFFSNRLYGDFGLGKYQTAYVYLTGHLDGAYVYNNILDGRNSGAPAHGAIRISAGTDSIVTNVGIYNNTISGPSSGSGTYGFNFGTSGTITNIRVYNNLVVNHRYAWYYENTTRPPPEADNNLYYNLSSYPTVARRGSTYYNLNDWRSYLGGCSSNQNECNSLYADPDLTVNLRPGSVSAGIDGGLPLQEIFNSDAAGNLRGVYWDIGAYEYFFDNTIPKAPSDLEIVPAGT
jgi:hypothetical protein